MDFYKDRGFEVSLHLMVKGRRVTEYLPVKLGLGNIGCYVEGRPGNTYYMRIINNGYNPAVVVPSIDGHSPINGQPATVYSGGYIVPPKGSHNIRVFHLDSNRGKEFEFQNVEGTSVHGLVGALIYPIINPKLARLQENTRDRREDSLTEGGIHSDLFRSPGRIFHPLHMADTSKSFTRLEIKDGYPMYERGVVMVFMYNTRAVLKDMKVTFDKRPKTNKAMLFMGSAKGFCPPQT